MDDPFVSPAQPWTWHGDWAGRVAASAVHAGHDVRPDLAVLMSLDEATRLREEDPFTDEIAAGIASRVTINRSRFEVDLNRDRAGAVYRTPADCWDLEVWDTGELRSDLVEESALLHEAFYAELAEHLDRLAAHGPFVFFDVHSYNHRRDGADGPEAPSEENPEVNVGTGSLDRERFAPLVDTFMGALRRIETSTGRLDVRENVRFKGAHVARWIHERYPGQGCVLALEFKKTFMDEWTGEPDRERISELAKALAATVPAIEATLKDLA